MPFATHFRYLASQGAEYAATKCWAQSAQCADEALDCPELLPDTDWVEGLHLILCFSNDYTVVTEEAAAAALNAS